MPQPLVRRWLPARVHAGSSHGGTPRAPRTTSSWSSRALTGNEGAKDRAAGEWWYLAFQDDDYWLRYEYFIDTSGAVTALVYQDSTMKDQESASVSIPLASYESEGDGPVGFYAGLEEAEREGYDVRRTTETITVGAGTYVAERIDLQGTDEETGERIDVTMWRTTDVPGDTVRFSYGYDNEQYDGELVEIGLDHRRRWTVD